MNYFNPENSVIFGLNYRIWISLVIYAIYFLPLIADNLPKSFRKMSDFIGLSFIGLYIGYIIVLTSLVNSVLGKLADNNNLSLIYTIIISAAIPLGKITGEIILRHETQGEVIKNSSGRKLYQILTNYFIYPLVSFIYTLVLTVAVLYIRKIISGQFNPDLN
jgi:hypothetical protein